MRAVQATKGRGGGKKVNEGGMDNEKHRRINRKRNRTTELGW
jgi:hypothetical protein